MSGLFISSGSLLHVWKTFYSNFRTYHRISSLCKPCLFRKCDYGGPKIGLSKYFSTNFKLQAQNELTVTFIKADGKRITAKAKEGDSLLDVVVNNNLDFDGFGSCEGTLTCSTCHCIFRQEDYDRFPEKPCDEEVDMLDLAYGLTKTSRLGCQIILSKELDGLEVTLPASVNDARS